MAIATRTTVAPHAGACFRSQHCAPGMAAMRRGALKSKHIVRAESDGRGFCSGDDRFKMSDYVEARVDSVQHIENQGPAIFLRFGSSHEFFLPVFVGQFEHDSLAKKLNDQTPARPPTHDLFKNSLEAMGYKVTKVRVTALIGNTYHARMHLATEDGSSEVDLDARPSDAINMAVRFRAPLYINREVAEKMGVRLVSSNRVDSIRTESHAEIVRSCRDELVHHADPTVMLRLQLQIAVSEENFEHAARSAPPLSDEPLLPSTRRFGDDVVSENDASPEA